MTGERWIGVAILVSVPLMVLWAVVMERLERRGRRHQDGR